MLNLLADGFTNDQIAQRMKLAVGTIKTHLRLLFKRVGARNAPHLVAIAYRRGWLRVTRRTDNDRFWLIVENLHDRVLSLRDCGACGHTVSDVAVVRSPFGRAWLVFRCRRCGAESGQSDRWVVPGTERFPPYFVYHGPVEAR